ncbi:hypothetical protein Zmor_008536 [Zophobas morio]|uniref:Uncharacterized protein n=1 Tax=Zophobas morio TaxID=2755281 RepID=A0AA38MR05_9CUCU|nr:hypothetical protein Zmor_008536 [Zophobas morio]
MINVQRIDKAPIVACYFIKNTAECWLRWLLFSAELSAGRDRQIVIVAFERLLEPLIRRREMTQTACVVELRTCFGSRTSSGGVGTPNGDVY